MASETKASEHIVWYCLPDSSPWIIGNSETASQVTLALLGTVFQTALTVLARHVQNQSRITQMRRICSSLILFLCELICAFTALWSLRITITLWTIWGLSLAGVYPAPYRRKKKSGKNQDQVYLRFRKSVKKIKSVASVLSVSHFERVRTEPKAKEQCNNS